MKEKGGTPATGLEMASYYDLALLLAESRAHGVTVYVYMEELNKEKDLTTSITRRLTHITCIITKNMQFKHPRIVILNN